ncbi:MAG: hypothetical protein HFH86_04550 [Bacilli bacterium]|jgi:hypothetical protein|nr:hypothetical protein [Bacilli bacterium]
MNVIVSNKYQSLISTLDIDIIKSLNGVFSADELVTTFSNFYFNKMILDITAIKDYQNISMIQELSVNMDMSKVILLLDDSEVVNSPRYLSQLVSMGIYNFTRNIDAVRFLIDNPNTYKDVAQYHQLNDVGNYEPVSVVPPVTNTDSTHTSSNVPMRVIGIKNITDHAGSTTLTYLLKKQLSSKYDVIAVEVDQNDFMYFNDKTLYHTTTPDLPQFIVKHANHEVILVDLNDKGPVSHCNEVIYLIEPGLIKLNKLIRKDRRAFEKLRDKKIVLNRSVLNEADIKDFEYESKSKVYFNLPYLDDKLDHHKILDEFLIKMGFMRIEDEKQEKGSKLFNIFK